MCGVVKPDCVASQFAHRVVQRPERRLFAAARIEIEHANRPRRGVGGRGELREQDGGECGGGKRGEPESDKIYHAAKLFTAAVCVENFARDEGGRNPAPAIYTKCQ